MVWVLSLFIPQGMHLMVPTHLYFFWAVCHPSRTFSPKEPKQKSQNRFSPLLTAKPCPLLPLTHDPPLLVLAGYMLMMSGPYTCSTSVYVQNMPAAYAFAVVWRVICTFCRPYLTSYGVSYFLIFHFYGLLPLEAGLC